MILEGKTVMVVGVGPGLGYSCAAAALRDGANVVVVARNEERLRDAAQALDPSGSGSRLLPADIMDQSSLDAAVDVAVQRFGGLHAVINVAALDTAHAPLIDLDDPTLRKNLEVNVLGGDARGARRHPGVRGERRRLGRADRIAGIAEARRPHAPVGVRRRRSRHCWRWPATWRRSSDRPASG
ncbi:MAG: SDR family NAD(P)-dependent oxidoreductase [Acidimicrobiales bacterium]